MARQGIFRVLISSIMSLAAPSISRVRPAPNNASITRLVSLRSATSRGLISPSHRLAFALASPLSFLTPPSRPSATGQPASLRYLATTNPSPPLLPGPQSTTTRRRVQRLRKVLKTERPAFSINSRLGTPAFTAKASARPISSTVRSSLLEMEVINSKCG